MNSNEGRIIPSRAIARIHAEEGESIWAVMLIALAIIGVMYIYDQAFAQATPPRQMNVSCTPPPAVVTDAETFKPRS